MSTVLSPIKREEQYWLEMCNAVFKCTKKKLGTQFFVCTKKTRYAIYFKKVN